MLLFFLAGTLEPAAPAPCGDVDSGAVLSECGTLHRSDVLHRSDDLLCRVAAPEAGDVTELSEYHSAQRLPGAGNGPDVYKFSTGLCKISTIQKGKTAKYYIIAQRMDVKLVRYSIWLSGTK